jgi:hypothetical protein
MLSEFDPQRGKFLFQTKKLCKLISEEQRISILQFPNDFLQVNFKKHRWYSMASRGSVKPVIKNLKYSKIFPQSKIFDFFSWNFYRYILEFF